MSKFINTVADAVDIQFAQARKLYAMHIKYMAEHGQTGNIQIPVIGGLLAVVIGLIVVMKMFPILWPMATEATDNATATLAGKTDVGSTTFVAFIPIILLVVGLGVAVAVLIWALREFNLFGFGN